MFRLRHQMIYRMNNLIWLIQLHKELPIDVMAHSKGPGVKDILIDFPEQVLWSFKNPASIGA